MQRTVYRTATSFDGFIADGSHSLGWLFAVPQDGSDGHKEFLRDVGAIVMGSSTYEWVLRETDMLARPEQWNQYYGSRPSYVFTTRDLPAPEGADVRFRAGLVSEHLPEIRAAPGGATTWVVGGGDLAGQFLDVGELDEIVLTVAPVSLGSGAAVLPRRVESDQLVLTNVTWRGQFVDLQYTVTHGSRGSPPFP